MRIIPTHVGRRTRRPLGGRFQPDHPHARGEKSIPGRRPVVGLGSSPRTWGEEHSRSPRASRHRIIPTHVGRRQARCSRPAARSDHPHARGEKPGMRAQGADDNGSSPRTWGEGNLFRRGLRSGRIIPTHVGRRTAPVQKEAIWADHPHARGEKILFRVSVVCWPGSSPRTWGEGLHGGPEVRRDRIIPTHVGRRARRRLRRVAEADHPHARGEKCNMSRGVLTDFGSSPRTWGEVQRLQRQGGLQRIIPTHVGRRACMSSNRPSPTDHPHARGEKVGDD